MTKLLASATKSNARSASGRSSNTILNCLFCGSDRLHIQAMQDDWGTAHFVRCNSCRAEGPHVVGDHMGDDDRLTPKVRREVIAKWNRTSIGAAPVARQKARRRHRPRPTPPQIHRVPNGAPLPNGHTNGHNGTGTPGLLARRAA